VLRRWDGTGSHSHRPSRHRCRAAADDPPVRDGLPRYSYLSQPTGGTYRAHSGIRISGLWLARFARPAGAVAEVRRSTAFWRPSVGSPTSRPPLGYAATAARSAGPRSAPPTS